MTLPSNRELVEACYARMEARIRQLEAELAAHKRLNADLEASDIRLRVRIGRLETAIRSISEHNHPYIDKWGNRTIWTAGCPACNPVETVTAALNNQPSPPG